MPDADCCMPLVKVMMVNSTDVFSSAAFISLPMSNNKSVITFIIITAVRCFNSQRMIWKAVCIENALL